MSLYTLVMKHTFFLLLLSLSGFAQHRVNEPLPYFSDKAVNVMDDEITGWSYSLDGQWVSAEKKIPIRAVSRNEDQYEEKRNKLGIDNITELRLYNVNYGGENLIALVKIMKNGHFKYPKTRKGWRSNKDAYYFIFSQNELNTLKNLEDGQVQVLEIPLVADGFFRDVKEKNITSLLREHVIIDKDYERDLIMTVQSFASNNKDPQKPVDHQKVRFQFFSQHELDDDVMGILNDFRLQGKSLYGSPQLFDHIYYECNRKSYDNFLAVAGNTKPARN